MLLLLTLKFLLSRRFPHLAPSEVVQIVYGIELSDEVDRGDGILIHNTTDTILDELERGARRNDNNYEVPDPTIVQQYNESICARWVHFP